MSRNFFHPSFGGRVGKEENALVAERSRHRYKNRMVKCQLVAKRLTIVRIIAM